MKKIFCLGLTLVVLLVSVLPIAAAEGITVDAEEKYSVNESFCDVPLSFEAWVSVPVGYGRVGVILGNYAGSSACVNFEITTNGRPRIYVVEYTSGEKVIHDRTFSGVDIRSGEMVHVAIVHDPDAKATHCYVNGELKSTMNGALNMTEEVVKLPHALAGDRRSGNSQYFKGEIGEVAIFSTVRSPEQIKADMVKVDPNAESLIALYDMTVREGTQIKDASGNGHDVTVSQKWIKTKEPVTDYAYSFCVVGDTQIIARDHPDRLADIYDWIIENKDEKKIEFVFGLGDITDKDTDVEWTAAKNSISKLNGVLPYSLARGNHDGSENLNKYFAKLDYMMQFDGFYDPYKIDNSWRCFSAGKTDYLLFTLDYGASDVILDWASGIIEAHPDHKVIITTHCYLFRDGTTLDAGDVCPPNPSGADNGGKNNGDQMWDKLVSKHENIFLVLSGHDPSDNVVATQTKGDHGNTVTQMLVDPQGVDSAEGATGMVVMLYFSEDGKTLSVEQYSTVKDMYYMNTSQFELPLPEDFWVVEEEAVTPDTEILPDPAPEQSDSDVGADIGIIGGADGPTAIFVAGQLWPAVVGGIVVLLAIGIAIGVVVGKKMKNK